MPSNDAAYALHAANKIVFCLIFRLVTADIPRETAAFKESVDLL